MAGSTLTSGSRGEPDPAPTAATAAAGEPGAPALLPAHLDAVVDVCSDALISLDREGRVVTWNRAAGRILGRGLELVAGALLEEAFPDRQFWRDMLARALSGERFEAVPADVYQGPGRRVPVVLALVPLRDREARTIGCFVAVRDRTEEVLAQQTLAESEWRVRRAEALALTGSFVIDAQDGSGQWSEGMYRIHGTNPAQFTVTLSSQLALVDEQDRAQVSAVFDRALSAEKPPGVDYRINRLDGRQSWAFLAVEPRFDARRQVLGLSGICQDITTRVASEAGLQNALEREQAVSDELRRLDALKDEFLATVSHELRTPLTSIAGFASLLRERVPEHRAMVEPIERNAGQMHRLIQRLLDQARLESGRVALEPKTLPLADAVRAVLPQIAAVFGDTRVVVDVADNVAVVMDPDAFTHILGNLLGNAAKYAPSGAITVRAEDNGGTVCVSVADEGPGIPLEHQQHLFDPFFRVPGADHSTRGSGFGLAIVRRYVELHGGTVWCESAGSGTTFLFTVPSARAVAG